MFEDLETKIETIKKTQTKGIIEMQNLGKWTGTTDVSITNKEKRWKQRMSGVDDTIGGIDSPVKENVKLVNS